MPKKLFTFSTTVTLNTEKAGGWLAVWSLTNDQDDDIAQGLAAWKNPSAAKKWLKGQAAEHTPRKSVKFVAGPDLDEKGKPVRFAGSLTFRDPK